MTKLFTSALLGLIVLASTAIAGGQAPIPNAPYRLQALVSRKLDDGLILRRPTVSEHEFAETIAKDKAGGIRYAEQDYFYLIGHPNAAQLADKDPVDCVAKYLRPHTIRGATYHAFVFVSK